MTRKQHFVIILILGTLSTISPFSIDMYLPGFPAIANDLNTTIDKVQFSLTAYFFGIAAGQLLYGPLLDRFGRKMPLYAGLGLYLLASVGCAFTHSIEMLVLMRLLQALGGCVGMVAAQALVRDLFPVSNIAQVFSLLTLVIAVSPMIAPTVGGYATVAFGWHSIFLILAGITVLILVAVYYALPNGRPADPSISLRPQAVLGNFFTVLRQPQFMTYAFAGGLSTASSFAYIAGSPDVFMNLYHVSEQQYGWIFAFLAIAVLAPNQLNHVLLKRFSNEQIVHTTLIYQSAVGLIMVFGSWAGWFGLTGLLGMLFLFLLGQGLVGPNSSALSMMPFARHAGSAAALMGSLRMGFGALVSAIVSLMHNGTALPMIGMMTFCAVGGLLILLIGERAIAHRSGSVTPKAAL
ncbi:Bcr/CflA family efflux MFS transporter [Rudanella paleaurantiibacter]|uniref:Bcr/CflA family efflux MFS transporter n=1 Tax=Rudanella paleaurantiibacter TaxID=2614655 RepID=A0A7J5U0D7_9BACT|nr:multidrug effflux MFS transporter [Rudanella paleaurantiibacter]KAB7731139.1 Bcr/CflA family efflux MFS transporter [Rudanella paleaurantiibacter]